MFSAILAGFQLFTVFIIPAQSATSSSGYSPGLNSALSSAGLAYFTNPLDVANTTTTGLNLNNSLSFNVSFTIFAPVAVRHGLIRCFQLTYVGLGRRATSNPPANEDPVSLLS